MQQSEVDKNVFSRSHHVIQTSPKANKEVDSELSLEAQDVKRDELKKEAVGGKKKEE